MSYRNFGSAFEKSGLVVVQRLARAGATIVCCESTVDQLFSQLILRVDQPSVLNEIRVNGMMSAGIYYFQRNAMDS